ncbi:MAG: acetyltransferase [archaeon GW2011_AR5]|nr:MAG: acetyltransferase [archaeon GW2011_AR5]
MKFNEGKIIEIFYAEKRGKKVPIIFRYPKKSDVKSVWKFYNKAIKETEGLSRFRFVSLKEEKKWVDDVLKNMKKGNKSQIMAESSGRIIGSVSIDRRLEDRRRHVGGFGIAILQEYAGIGIGKRMMKLAEKDAGKMGLKIIELHVHGKNKIAQSLYRKMGYRAAGKVPKSVKTRNGFDDDILMYKVLKKL